MMICNNCGEIFDDDAVVYETVCWEDYYGVGSMFQNKNYGTMATCPCCGSDDLDDYWEDDEEDDDEE